MKQADGKFSLYDIVRVTAPDPERSEYRGYSGYIAALRPEEDIYTADVCRGGYEYNCQNVSFHAHELEKEGGKYVLCNNYQWHWPPLSLPKFQEYEYVRLREGVDGPLEGVRTGMVYELPDSDIDGTWWYSVRFCRDGPECWCSESRVMGCSEEQLMSTGEPSPLYQQQIDRPPRFTQGERVLIRTSDPEKAEADGRLAWSASTATPRFNGGWSYAVAVYGEDELWMMYEEELVPTGEFEREGVTEDGEFRDSPS